MSNGEKYLNLFEEKCKPPVKDIILKNKVENAYRSIIYYYYSRNNKTKARSIAERGLKYVPGSMLINSAMD